jgi:hypothetical protein
VPRSTTLSVGARAAAGAAPVLADGRELILFWPVAEFGMTSTVPQWSALVKVPGSWDSNTENDRKSGGARPAWAVRSNKNRGLGSSRGDFA